MASFTTNVPRPYFGLNGWQSPTEAQIFAGVVADFQAAFGSNINMALNTPQGQWASSITAFIGNAYDTFVYYTNQVDPAYAIGRMQDGIGRIYFVQRNPATPTVLSVNCVGMTGVVIPVGAIITDTSGNLYDCTASVIIPVGGSIATTFEAEVPGPTAVPASNAISVYQSIPGWDAVNCIGGTLGGVVESPQAFESRRGQSVAHNSLGSLPSVLGAVLDVPGVLDAYVTENVTSAPMVVGGVTLLANSLYVAVVGGLAQDVATAIWRHKSPGCGYNGNTTVTVLDTSPGYVPPYPAYQVTFQVPTSLPIYFVVTLVNSTGIPSNALTLIQNAIVAAAAGLDGGPAVSIAGTVLASRYYAPVAALGAAWANIINIEIGSFNAPTAVINASISGTTMTVNSASFGTLAVGQILDDTIGNVVTGTGILTQLTGPAGGVGTYTVSNSQTFGAQTIYSLLANAFKVSAHIDQIPSITAGQITLALQS